MKTATLLRESLQARSSDAPFQSAADSLLEGFQIIGFDWKYLYVNATAARHGRRKREEFLGKRVMDVFPGIQRTPLFRTLRRCMTTRRPCRTETKFTYPNGAHAFFELSIGPAPEGIVILSIDISHQKHVQADLTRTLALLKRAQEIAHVGSYELTHDGSSRWADETFRIMGLQSGSHVAPADYLVRFVHPADQDHVKQALIRAFKKRTRYEAEYRIVRPNGEIRYVHSVAEPLPGSKGKALKYVGAVQDVTDRRQLEREILKISDQEKSRIGQDLHDGLCQELAGIEFRLIELKYEAARQSEHCARELEKLARTVRDAISETRSIAHGLSPIKIGSDGLMNALKELAAATQKNFRVSCELHCPTPLHIDDNVVATHLYRIAQEAVHNAIRHGKPKRIVITLVPKNDRIILGIRDDGKGFHPTRRKNRGIGLRLMQYRASVIQGSLIVHHVPAGGAEVVCSLHHSALSPPKRKSVP